MSVVFKKNPQHHPGRSILSLVYSSVAKKNNIWVPVRYFNTSIIMPVQITGSASESICSDYYGNQQLNAYNTSKIAWTLKYQHISAPFCQNTVITVLSFHYETL